MLNKRVICLTMATIFVLALFLMSGCNNQQATTTQQKAELYNRPDVVANADEAIQLLIKGNDRFTSGKQANKDISDNRKEKLVTDGQNPFAVVVSCSDSRLPPELLFDQALGDLFVIRLAGNIVDPVAIGSVEYGVGVLGSPLLVVLGHEKCGAVKATVDGGEVPGSIGSIIAKIQPSADKARATGATGNDLYELATDENIKAVIADLQNSSIVKSLVDDGKLIVIGAKYHMHTGEVVFDYNNTN